MKSKSNDLIRCLWSETSPEAIAYHDHEWGDIRHDDNVHHEYLVMEVMQCGLSWYLMLKKRPIFKTCFADFDFTKVALFSEKDVKRIMSTNGMIKSEPKIRAVIANTIVFLKIREEFGSFDKYIWSFSNNQIIIFKQDKRITQSEISIALSKDLKKRGCKYLGPTVLHSHLQSVGIIFAHHPQCWKYKQFFDKKYKNIIYI